MKAEFWWPRQESNLDLELRKLLYYPLYNEALCFAVTLLIYQSRQNYY